MSLQEVRNKAPGNITGPYTEGDIPKTCKVRVGDRWVEGKAVQLIPVTTRPSQDDLSPEVRAKLDAICKWASQNYPCWTEEMIAEMSAKGLFGTEIIQ